jgi:hypothetical protein
MNALILDGTIEKTAFGDRSLEALQEVFDKHSIPSETVVLRERTIAHCRGCFDCWIKTPGICIIDDEARDITRKIIQSDLVVYFTPVLFGGYSHFLKAQLDRSIGLLLPTFGKFHGEIHHKKRYEAYPSLLGVGLLTDNEPKQADLFREHIHRNSLNLHNPRAESVILQPNFDYSKMTQTIGEVLSDMEVFA